ncbi:MAG: NUDIX domain-containing protein [Candidatus Paceibacterota bacterium]|jgi:CheY-like chemotaxis protein
MAYTAKGGVMELHHIALVLLLNAKEEVLLARRVDNWELPGGHVEPADGSREKAFVREIREETQLRGIFNKRLLFSRDEHKEEKLYMFDIYVGHCYDERFPGSLVAEGIIETKWWSLDETKGLTLTPMASKALNFLKEKRSSFISECRHHFHVVLNEAKLQGAGVENMENLKKKMEECIEMLSIIGQLPPAVKSKAVGKQKVIVMVDDDEYTLYTLKKLFSAEKYRVYSFSDPREALDWLKESSVEVDALVTDQRMHCIYGSELLRKVRELKILASAKFVLISGEEVPADDKKGFDKFFVRPVSPDELIRVIS